MMVTGFDMIDESTGTVFKFEQYPNGGIIKIGNSVEIKVDTFEEFVNLLVKAEVISVYD